MVRPRTPTPTRTSVATSETTVALTSLVGWTVDAPLIVDEPVSPRVAREMLALALGLDEDALTSLSDADVNSALRRMRVLIDQFERLAAKAATDELTGILRRGPGVTALQREIDRERRKPSRGIAVVFVDVDGLKRVNDTFGHAAGDRLLVDVVDAVRQRIRSYDLLFRYGGDEFVFVLVDIGWQDAVRTVEEIRADIAVRSEGSTVSAGAARVREGDDAERVVTRADHALYRRRRQERG